MRSKLHKAKQSKLHTVDNSSDGNCMYYAYAISLMYHLRKRGDMEAAERLFTRLDLDSQSKAKLFYLLEHDKNKPYTRTQIREIIEPILGPALRVFAARMTGVNFLENPKDSSLFTATNYGMIYLFKKMLQQNNRLNYAQLFESNHFDNENFTEAEIYKVPGIFPDEMNDFLERNFVQIRNLFNKGWDQYARKKRKELRESNQEPPKEGFESFYRRQFLEEIIGDMTVSFFKENNHKNLLTYMNHLNTSYHQWGTEETLMIMHNKLQKEIRETVKVNIKGRMVDRIQVYYETPMSLQLYRNGVPYFSSEEHGEPDIILNNSGNLHWLSYIDSTAQSVVTRNDLLDIVGFNGYLEKLLVKSKIDQDPMSADLSKLYQRLNEEKENYLSNSEVTREGFATICDTILSEAYEIEGLQNQKGILDVISSLMNCLYLLCTLDFKNLFSGNWSVVNPLSLDTAYHHVGALKTSVSLLEDSEIPDLVPSGKKSNT